MKQLRLFLILGAAVMSVNNANAATISAGNIGATLTLSNGCLINGSPSQSGINFGTLDFGNNPATFGELTTQLSGTGVGGAGTAFTIQCTTTSYTVRITGNTNSATPGSTVGTPGATPRYLRTASNTQGIAYSVYNDSGFGTEIGNNTNIARSSNANGIDSYTLYARIQGGGNSVTVLPGIYTDTLNVNVTY